MVAIETSCDETAVAIVQTPSSSPLSGGEITILAQAVASQVDIHKETGGVIPEVAAREHVVVLQPMLAKVLREAKVKGENIDALAVTVGPGLMPALAVGVQAARTLAFAWNKPVVPVHHIEGHIYSALFNSAEEIRNPKSKIRNLGRISNFFISQFLNFFPALALVVSGGHTLLIRMDGHLQYKVLGSTRDDAAGEAFDKVARILGLPYPGGPHVSRLAGKGDASKAPFPVPMMHSEDLDFSFSGLKTAVLYKVRGLSTVSPPDKGGTGGSSKVRTPSHSLPDQVESLSSTRLGNRLLSGGETANIASGFQEAVIESLIGKTRQALEEHDYETLLLAGGVAANKPLRKRFVSLGREFHIRTQIASLSLCSDNAIMIGLVGVLAYAQGRQERWQKIDAAARIDVDSYSVK